MTDHKNEIFYKWKLALDAGDFSKADYFRQIYWDFEFAEKNLGALKQEVFDKDKVIDSLKKDFDAKSKQHSESAVNNLELVGQIQKLEAKNAELKRQLEKHTASKPSKK